MIAGQTETQMAGVLFAHEDIKSDESTSDQKTNKSEQNDQFNQIASLTLTDPLQAIDFKDRFTVNKHLFFSLFLGGIFMIFGNASFYGLPKSLRFISIGFFVITLSSCLLFILYGKFGTAKSLDVFLSERLLHIADETKGKDILLMNWNNKAGVVTVFLYIYSSVSVLLFEALYSDVLYDTSRCGQNHEMYRAQCLAVYSTFSQTMPAMWAVYLFVSFRKVKCTAEVQKLKQMVLDKYETAKTIDQRITNDFLGKWKQGKKWEERRSQWIYFFVLSLFMIICVQGFLRHDIPSIEINTALDGIAIGIGILHYCVDAGFWSIFFYFCFGTMMHYDFPYEIMMGLLSPINVNDANDVIAWWELRKLYIETIGNIYCFSLGFAIFLLIVGILTFGVYLLATLGTVHTAITLVYATGLSLGVIATFRMVANAVSYHNVQLLHVGTMNKEKIRLNHKFFYDDGDESKKSKNETLLNIIDFITIDIEANSVPIRVLGVHMNYNFMLFLRGTVITFAILFLSVWLG
eukprot:29552_1